MKKLISLFLSILIVVSILVAPQLHIVFANGEDDGVPQVVLTNVDKYENMSIYSNKVLLCSADGEVFDTTDNFKFNSNDLETGIFEPMFAEETPNNFVVFDSLKRIQIYNKSFEHTKTLNLVSATTPYNLGNIVDVTKDYSGNLFFLDITNQKVLNLKNDILKIEEVNLTLSFTITADTKICANPNGNLLAILENNKVYVFDLSNLALVKELDIDAEFVLFDYLGNLFCAKCSADKITISKYVFQTYTYDSNFEIEKQIRSLSVDIETGTFYFLSDALYTVNKEGFCANASDEVAPVDITTTTLLAEQCTFAKAKIETKLFATCVSFSSSDTLNQNQTVIVLENNIPQNQAMCYCLTNIDGHQKLGYAKKSDLLVINVVPQQAQYKTIYKNVKVLTYPTHNAGVSQTIANENTTVAVIGTANNFVDEDGNSYYSVLLENGVGYINQESLQNTNNYESLMLDIEPTPDNSTQFMAYILVFVSSFILVIIVCIFIARKKS